jgi:hypothetical protein
LELNVLLRHDTELTNTDKYSVIDDTKAFEQNEPIGQHVETCYRMRPYLRNVGVLCTIFFAIVGIVTTAVAYFNIDGSFARPELAAYFFGLFWSTFTLLGLWLLLAYSRYRLYIRGLSIRQVGVFTESTIDLRLVQELKWRRFPQGGSVTISAVSGVMKIDLGNLSTSERDQVITVLRASVDESRQIGWNRFEEQFSITPVKRQKSLRAQLLLTFIFGAHVIAFGVIWIYSGEFQYLIFSGLNGLMTGYLLRRYRRQLSEQPPLTAQI